MNDYVTAVTVAEAFKKYRKMGWSVIPLNKNKEPLIKWGEFSKRIATDDEVDAWLTQFPRAQIGIVTGLISNLVVVDVEAGGDSSMYPSTLTVKTGGGGYHFYYQYPGKVTKNATRIAELTDIRGDGGYVVAPPSVSSKGAYSWHGITSENAPDITNLPIYPGGLLEVLSTFKNKPVEATSELIPVGMRNEAAAKQIGEIVSRMGPERWDKVAWPEVVTWNVTALSEPLPDVELRKVFNSITKLRLTELEQRDIEEFVLKPFTLRELYAEDFPPIQWVAKDLIPLGCLGAITGESNSYKSFMTLALSQAVATGAPYLGHFGTTAGKVLVIDEENNRRIIEQRFRNMDIEAHDDIVFLSHTGLQIDREAHRTKLLKYVDTLKPRLIILDSMVRLHGRDENSATEMRQVMKALGSLVAPERSVIFIHHHKKDQGHTRKAGSGSLRGSTDIFNALDFHLAIERRTENLMVRMLKLRVQPELPPFKAGFQMGENNSINFSYLGVDTSKEENTQENIEKIVHMLSGIDEAVSRTDIKSALSIGDHAMNTALAKLKKDGVITVEVKDNGKHMFRLIDDRPEPDVSEEENDDEEVVTNIEDDGIPF
ncbi:AAA family ATPase [Patescibacteria group bacterium]|nr:AAA family ATPase [Patescibacteria group bacterium]